MIHVYQCASEHPQLRSFRTFGTRIKLSCVRSACVVCASCTNHTVADIILAEGSSPFRLAVVVVRECTVNHTLLRFLEPELDRSLNCRLLKSKKMHTKLYLPPLKSPSPACIIIRQRSQRAIPFRPSPTRPLFRVPHSRLDRARHAVTRMRHMRRLGYVPIVMLVPVPVPVPVSVGVAIGVG